MPLFFLFSPFPFFLNCYSSRESQKKDEKVKKLLIGRKKGLHSPVPSSLASLLEQDQGKTILTIDIVCMNKMSEYQRNVEEKKSNDYARVVVLRFSSSVSHQKKWVAMVTSDFQSMPILQIQRPRAHTHSQFDRSTHTRGSRLCDELEICGIVYSPRPPSSLSLIFSSALKGAARLVANGNNFLKLPRDREGKKLSHLCASMAVESVRFHRHVPGTVEPIWIG